MAYEKQNFQNGEVLTAEQLIHMENGIAAVTPDTATVGQFLVVSAVDENGKVTATEAVTLLDAEGVAF